ncbi:hypothetical protein OE749_09170 [Aestuariibacter sp. AA17]|uniref:PEP-CTERM protein-sorting domain-containing protein n=1 Tax=Fluctibacter corallii TaxID=2984329 RepID=A0ABT3A858_9ALTE|nr:hypothetical protein [Aestuariibacter sp. AA17]MCV2884865.1 hypothetical protein [Aestuariibacter sp. AA17]
MKTFLVGLLAVLSFSTQATLINVAPSSPALVYEDAVDGTQWSRLGLSSGAENYLNGQSGTLFSDLFAAVIRGNVLGFYAANIPDNIQNTYGISWDASVDEGQAITDQTTFASVADRGNGRFVAWDSIWVNFSGNVVFSNGSGGTNTLGSTVNAGQFNVTTDKNTATAVPEPHGLLLTALSLLLIAAARRKA